MSGTPNGSRSAPLIGIFITVFVSVFLLIAVTTTLVTFILPESYASEARLKLGRPGDSSESKPAQNPYEPTLVATEVETMLSEAVLGKVVEELNLNAEWGRKFFNGERLKTSESLEILKGRLDIRSIPNTTLISIQAFSEDREEAARVANAVAQAYLHAAPTLSPSITVQVIDRALPGLRPVRPNKPLNIALGMIVGAILGGGCAAVVTALTANYRSLRKPGNTPPGPPTPPN